MREFKSSDAQNRFGQVLQHSATEPVSITRNGVPVAIVLSAKEYERLQQLEDYTLGLRALQAEKEGYLGPEETMRLLNEKLQNCLSV